MDRTEDLSYGTKVNQRKKKRRMNSLKIMKEAQNKMNLLEFRHLCLISAVPYSLFDGGKC